MFIVTVDSGTTNTRVRVWQNNRVIVEASETVGVRDTASTGNTQTLINGLKKAFDRALNEAEISGDQPITIIASGMITSNIGLCEIPHLQAPVSLSDLAKGMVKKVFPVISAYPIHFIPGVKNNVANVELLNCEAMDIMRGEETEAIGALSYFDLKEPALVILPGSHSKFVKINQQQKIAGSATTMAGELLDVITKKTLLSHSLNHQFAQEIDEDYLLQGAKSCQEVGLVRSCFLVRVLDLFSHCSVNQRANYLLGAVLYSDISTIKNSKALNMMPETTIIICGKKILCQAITILIRHDPFFSGHVISKDEDKNRPLSMIGAITIAEHWQQLESSLENSSYK